MITSLSNVQHALKRALNNPWKIDVARVDDGRYRARVLAFGGGPLTECYGPTPLDALFSAAQQAVKHAE
jgi:hypothetical protein